MQQQPKYANFQQEKQGGVIARGVAKVLNTTEHSNFAHGAELAGLGILAAPSVSNMASGKGTWKDKAEVGGLGVLALPSLSHFASGFAARSKALAPHLMHK
jgi:hypothetical protein